MDGDLARTVSAVVEVATLAGVAVVRLTWVPLDRAGFALVGAAALLVSGVLDLRLAATLVDVEVLVLLFGLGSVASLIVAESAARHGAHIGFWTNARVGVPVTLATLALGVAWQLG